MVGKKAETGTQAAPRNYPKGLLNAAIVLAAISGILHVYVGYVIEGLENGSVLILIALVYFVGAALVAANYKRDLWLKVGPAWVALVIFLWALVAAENVGSTRDPVAYLIKADEVVLLGVLFQVRRVIRRPRTAS